MSAVQQVIAALGGGLSVVVGSLQTFGSGSDQNYGTCDACSLDTNKVAMAYRASTGFVNIVVMSISGTTFTAGTVVVPNATTSNNIVITALSTTLMVCSWTEGSLTVKAVAMTVSGTTITLGTVVTVRTATVAANQKSICKISFTRAALVVGTNTGSRGNILDISGTTITVGADALITSDSVSEVKIALANNSAIVAAYRNDGGTFIPQMYEVAFSGSAFGTVQLPSDIGEVGTQVDIFNIATSFGWVVANLNTYFASSYTDAGGLVPMGVTANITAAPVTYGQTGMNANRVVAAVQDGSGVPFRVKAGLNGAGLLFGPEFALPFVTASKLMRSVVLTDNLAVIVAMSNTNVLAAVAVTF